MIHFYSRTCAGRFSRVLFLGALLMVLAGCERTIEPASVEVVGPLNDLDPGGGRNASADQPIAESSQLTEPTRNTENEKVVIDVSAFLDAAFDGKFETVRQAIEAGVNINSTDEQQRSALLLASFNGHTSVVKLLLAQGALLNHRDAMGRTALMFAATGANAETVQLLIDEGAEVNAVDTDEGFTALMHAAAEGQVEVVQILLKHKADPALRDVDGDTARDFATRNGHSAVVKLLLK